MVKEIIVNARRESTRIALVEDGQLAEFHIETPDHERTIGNIYLGRVKKVMPNIRAAFVDIGERQDAFLHFSDLTDNLPLLLSFLEQDAPEVGHHRIRVEARLARKKRRFARARRKGIAESGVSARRTAIGHLLENRHPQRRVRKPVAAAPKRAALPALPKQRTLDGYLQQNQRLLVKIIKEPISSKGSRVSTDISLAGRFVVLVPLADYVAVSKKISSFRERKRLRALVKSLTPEGFGVIVRTQAEGQTARALDTDLRLLVDKWRKIERHLQGRPQHPKTVYEDVNMVSSVVRDLFSEDFKRILVDEPRLFKNLKGYVQAVAPALADCVQFHDSNRPVFEAVGIEQQLRLAFETRVPMPSGGYLIIERTEAMHVVDVNSGRAGKGLSQEENALRVDVEAARTICQHLRLRDLGGIICIDFIDLRDEKNRRKVLDEIKKEFRKDRAVTKVLPMSDFGIVQITRQRLRPSFTTWADDGGDGTEHRDQSVPGRAERARDDRRDEERRRDDRPRNDRRDERRRDERPRDEPQNGERARDEPTADRQDQRPRRDERSDERPAPSDAPGLAPETETTARADAGAQETPQNGERRRRRRGGRGRHKGTPEGERETESRSGVNGVPEVSDDEHHASAPDAEALAESLEAAAEGEPRKKRRRRGGRGRNKGAQAPETQASEIGSNGHVIEDADAVIVDDAAGDEVNGDDEAPRVQPEAVAEINAEDVLVDEEVAVDDAAVVAETPKPRRARAKKAADAQTETAVDAETEATAPEKPKRTRTKKADAPAVEAEAAGAVVTATPEAEPAKPKRSRAKKAEVVDTTPEAPVAEPSTTPAAEADAANAPAKPRRPRAKKTDGPTPGD